MVLLIERVEVLLFFLKELIGAGKPHKANDWWNT